METLLHKILNYLLVASASAALTISVIWIYGLYNPRIIYVESGGTKEIIVSQICDECRDSPFPVLNPTPKRRPPIRNVITY